MINVSTESEEPVRRRVVVVGAGHGGSSVAAGLRRAGFTGDITIFGAEPHYPYHRPPLSKELVKDWTVRFLRDERFYDDQSIVVHTGQSVESIDRAERTVTTSTGHVEPYDELVLATGASPRRLPALGADLPEVMTLRSLDDAHLLRDAIRRSGPLVIIGAGYIGLEVAATARAAGVEVTVIERMDRALARVASPRFADLITDAHRDRGVKIFTDTQVAEIVGENGHVAGVRLESGEVVACTVVLVGIGAVPDGALADAAGLRMELGGVVINDSCQTSYPHIYAIGDVAVRVSDTLGPVRMESIPSATEQANQVVAHIMGSPIRPLEAPWFWSDQFDLKLKIAGRLTEPYETELRGDPSTGKFALRHSRDGALIAVESSNSPGEFMAARKELGRPKSPQPALLTPPASTEF